jgi:tRNA A-37 threonylcarbamoyl transferase component Bud32
MSERVTLVRRPDGALAARKAALPSDLPDRLRTEAAMLRRARHPGVAVLLDEDHEGLLLAWIGHRSLATHRVASTEEAAGVLASVATTLADLHRIGITHGAVDASHVVLDPTGRPVLCSFATARHAGSVLEPGHVERCAADVAGLGHLLDTALREAGPDSMLRWARGGPRRGARRALERLAERAVDERADRRPSARAFAQAITDATPAARLTPALPSADGVRHEGAAAPAATDHTSDPELSDPDPYDLTTYDRLRPVDEPAPPVRHPRPRTAATVVAVALVGLVLLVILATSGFGPPGRPPDAVGSASAPRPRDTSVGNVSPITASTAPVRARRDCPAVEVTGLHADLDGDGCREPLTITGHVVSSGARRWAVGEPGDVVAVADWDCDGTATPAMLRTRSGDVFVFSSWSPPRGSTDVTAVSTVAGATAIHPSAGICPRLLVERREGAPMTVPIGEERP